MDRRTFLKEGCKGCAGVLLLGLGAGLLGGCGTLPLMRAEAGDHKLRIPLSRFAEQRLLLVRTGNLPFDVLAVKEPDGQYRALYLQCTHQDQPLTATPTGLHCPAHGSRFDLEGRVRQGPAANDLLQFNTSVQGTDLIINIP